MLLPAGLPDVVIAVWDPDVAGRLAQSFGEHGALPTLVFSADHLLHALDSRSTDLVVVGTDLAGGRAGMLLDAVRSRTDGMVLTLSPDGDAPQAGADLCLPHGTPPAVIAAQGMLLAGVVAGRPLDGTHRWGPLELHPDRRLVRWLGREVTVTPIQFRLLYILVLAGGAVVTKRDLHRLLWGSAVVDDGERVAAHVKRIRAKLEGVAATPSLILTVRGEGYRLADVEQAVGEAPVTLRPG